ncbi:MULTISPECIES: HEAT repeat domain-containing protein [unclassified Streptomyces]|uniref:HEAT repeat domain-containing protein n=1 Tax=unclassified Streptomyces TaxID=2593676 RepID=UPI00136DDEB7|nr:MULTISPECIES: HEAT repeat domain-containing protein [unclassified Streptomyces]MYS22492.1 hypothetical protein [Streptomyces sp. SID4948]
MSNDAAALIAAVRAGDTNAAEKLLAAGAPADARDETGYTALGLAVVRADTAMCELLVRHGADTDLRCPGGRTPVMLAADGGVLGAWHELRGGSPDFSLRDDLGQDAMDLARAWLGVDPGEELLRRLGAANGDDARITRGPAPDEGIGSFEVVHVATRTAAASVQTGHAAILTELEEVQGIRVPYAELAERALTFDPGHVCRFYAASAVADRVDDETFVLAARDLTAAPDPGRRRFAAEVLLTYGLWKEEEDETTVRLEKAAGDLLRRRAAAEDDPGVLIEILCGLGLRHDTGAFPEILRRARHPDPEVRAQVAAALRGMVPPGDNEVLRTVLALAEDPDRRVRRNAAATLSDTRADTPDIRTLLARLMDDADPDVVVEGARGLGLRHDPRADIPLVRAFINRVEDSEPEVHRTWDVIRLMPADRFRAARDALDRPSPATAEQQTPSAEPR